MGEGERGEGSPLTPWLIIFFFALGSAFALLNLFTNNKEKNATYAGYNWKEKWATYK